MSAPSTIEPLVSLGFTDLEAHVYTFLLQESPATGYRVAQALRKPAPNIYKAIESLEGKGALMIVAAGANRLCRPVPPGELLGHLERRFQRSRSDAARSLSELYRSSDDDRVYQLQSAEAVLERCRAMLDRAEDVALLDVFPGPVDTLRPDILECAKRGVLVALKAYAPVDLPGVKVVLDPRHAQTIERWPGDWLNLVVDGSEHLVAFFDPEGGVHQAIWSGSPYLSWVYHCGVASEIALDGFELELEKASSLEELRENTRDLLLLKSLDAAGYQTLVEQVAEPPPPPGNGKRRKP